MRSGGRVLIWRGPPDDFQLIAWQAASRFPERDL